MSGSLFNGGLYIKLCQGLAALNHILPKAYTETLILLQDQVQYVELIMKAVHLRAFNKINFFVLSISGFDKESRRGNNFLMFYKGQSTS
jgi:hypothetical protein